MVSELKQQREDVDRLETALAKSQEDYAELENLKDKEEVKALRRRTAGSEALKSEFDDLIKAVEKAKPNKISNVVLKHLIADHFDAAGTIDWTNYRQEFEDAVKYRLISGETGRVQWNRDKLQPFKEALEAVQTFLDSQEGRKVRRLQDDNVPMDPDDLEFWEYHLDL